MREWLEFFKLVRPFLRFSRRDYQAVVTMLPTRTISGDYSVVAALLFAVSSHHIGNIGVAMAYYEDIYEKANRMVFFNEDSTEHIKAFVEQFIFEVAPARSYDARKVNHALWQFFPIGLQSVRGCPNGEPDTLSQN
jgi:hypothetical protein